MGQSKLLKRAINMHRSHSTGDGATDARPGYSVAVAFVVLVLAGGSNAVAVRFSNLELPPFWGAAMRFGAAALIFWILVVSQRMALPEGRALIGAILYGLLAVGASYAFLYWSLQHVQASLAMVVLAFVPLITFVLALVHGLETFRWRVLTGAMIGVAGILFAVGDKLGNTVPVTSFLGLVAGAACLSEGAIVFKVFPKGNLVATNALALTTGSSFLLSLSLTASEKWTLPTTSDTVTALIYLVFVGSVAVFYLYLFLLTRWDASATAYTFLLFPVATVVIAALVAGEVVTGSFVIGGGLALVGVWMGGVRANQ